MGADSGGLLPSRGLPPNPGPRGADSQTGRRHWGPGLLTVVVGGLRRLVAGCGCREASARRAGLEGHQGSPQSLAHAPPISASHPISSGPQPAVCLKSQFRKDSRADWGQALLQVG